MRTWKVILVPFCRMGESSVVESSLAGWEVMVTRGMNSFQEGQVEVSVRAAQTAVEGAAMKIELPMWRVAFAASIVGVARSAFWGSERGVDIFVMMFVAQILLLMRRAVEWMFGVWLLLCGESWGLGDDGDYFISVWSDNGPIRWAVYPLTIGYHDPY